MHIRVSDISFSFSRWPVLRNVAFDVRPGEFLTILGPNGSGKSTLLRLLARILLPSQGAIFLGDHPLAGYERNQLARIIGFVPQDPGWFFPFTVMEVVLMGRTPYVGKLGFENREDILQAERAMELTDVAHLAGKPVTAISGGERQRVLIARALAQQPKILLLDEPNAHLDLSHQIDVFRILRRQQQEGITVVSVTHDLNLASAFSSNVVLLARTSPGEGSTIVAGGSPETVLTAEFIQKVFQTDVVVDRSHPGGPVRIFLNPEQLQGIQGQ